MNEIEELLNNYTSKVIWNLSAAKVGTDQQFEVTGKELDAATKALLAKFEALRDRCEVLQGAWTTRNGIAEALEAEIKELKTDNQALREANSNLEILVSAYLDKIVYRDTENLELKAELAIWRKETKWGGVE